MFRVSVFSRRHRGDFTVGIELKKLQIEHGDRFGKLTVLREVAASRGQRFEVGCVCGGRFKVRVSKLRKGEVTSCGRATCT